MNLYISHSMDGPEVEFIRKLIPLKAILEDKLSIKFEAPKLSVATMGKYVKQLEAKFPNRVTVKRDPKCKEFTVYLRPNHLQRVK